MYNKELKPKILLPFNKKYILSYSPQKSKAHEETKTKNGKNVKIIQFTVFEAMQIKTINSFFSLAYKFKGFLPSIRIGVEKVEIAYPTSEIQIDRFLEENVFQML